ncbi:MAG: prepilin peptidase [Mycobacterium sp.]|uniref:prepilin peptidase n=1 Tax=Mycobacterium sp. TaxID=1785 RepID=UPI003899F5E1
MCKTAGASCPRASSLARLKAFETIYAALFGAAAGSFLNVVVWRVPRGESIAVPPSHCTNCETRIKARDNVPVLSWALLRGRCRACGTAISARYPLIELGTALLFAAIVLIRGLDWDLAWQLPFAAMLVAVAAIDLDHHIVPNKILLPAAVWGVVSAALIRLSDLPELLAWGAGAFLFLLVAALVYPAGMGMGDVKLAGVMGLYLGSSVLPALLAGFLSGSVVGVVMLARHGAAARKMGVPFAPFLALGAVVGLLAGPELVDLYRNSFL